jgi:type IV secretion system protein VirB6
MTLNAVVLTWFAFFALGLSAFIGGQIFVAIQSGGGFTGGNLNVLSEAIRYCVLMILMGILCFQAPSLASALTGGAAVQQGIQMVQNTMMVAGIWSATTARSAGRATAGGFIRPGTGNPHTVGRAAGTTALSGARFAGTLASGAGAIARQGYGLARTAAYRLAALRGSV